MENAVENLPPSASGVMSKNGMRGTAGNNPSFFRTTEEGEIKCWMAVDAETGTIDIRDENEKTLIEINAKTKKVFLAGLDLGRGIEEAQESADSANEEVSQAREDIEDVREKVRVAQIAADQAIEDAAEVQPALLQKIRDEGVELQHGQRLTTREDGQLLINEKTFKGEKGEQGEKGDQGIQGVQGIQGIQGEKGETGEQGIQGITGESGTSRFLDFVKKENVKELGDGENTVYEAELNIRESSPIRVTFVANCQTVFQHNYGAVHTSLNIDGKTYQRTNRSFNKGYRRYHTNEINEDFLVAPLNPGKHRFQITVHKDNAERSYLRDIYIGVAYL